MKKVAIVKAGEEPKPLTEYAFRTKAKIPAPGGGMETVLLFHDGPVQKANTEAIDKTNHNPPTPCS